MFRIEPPRESRPALEMHLEGGEGLEIHEAEQRVFGFDHADVGEALLERTRLFLWYSYHFTDYPISDTHPCEILIPPFLNNLGIFARVNIPLRSKICSVINLTYFFCYSSKNFWKIYRGAEADKQAV
jgi:hypothetical protein